MKTIGIVTLTKNANYGNVLQNIALQIVIKRFDCKAETIKNMVGSSLFLDSRCLCKHIFKFLLNKDNYRKYAKRNKVFRKFCLKNIEYSNCVYTSKGIRGESSIYDIIFTGSDQVWNPNFGFASEFEFLSFVPKEKRASYAASFGVAELDDLPSEKKLYIAKMLKEMRYISVREDSGKNIIENMTELQAFVHLDPTMLLTGEEWLNYAIKPKTELPDKYILVYMLGNLSEQYITSIEELARDRESKIINIFDNRYNFINPFEFLWMIKNSEAVCTDSFHASVFSILFHQDFYIFNRVDMHADQSSRFKTLLDKCGVDSASVDISNRLSDSKIDWDMVDNCLKNERNKSLNYISTVLNC